MAAARVDRSFGVKEIKLRQRRCEIEIRVIESSDRSDVFPIVVENMRLDVALVNRRGNHFAAEIDP